MDDELNEASKLDAGTFWQQITRGPTMTRGAYFVAGSVLAAIKYNLDRFVAMAFYDTYWTPFSYLHPSKDFTLLKMPQDLQEFYLVMVAIAIPFLTAGVVFTLRRLRDVGLPQWLTVFFIVPVINLLFFAMLCVLPTKLRQPQAEVDESVPGFIRRMVPESAFGSALAGLLFTVPPALVLTLVGIHGFGDYGYGLFVGLPFVVGAGSVVIYGVKKQRSFVSCMGVSILAVWALGALYFILLIEGALCLAMAFPIGIVLSMLGGVVGYFVQRLGFGLRDSTNLLAALFVSVPLFMGFEHVEEPHAAPTAVVTSVQIDASPQQVWDELLAFSELPPPDDWILQAGIAYPTSAEIHGHGVGAIRHCNFTTGPFVEPIEVWDEPRLLKFSVQSQPPAMTELSYTNIDAPHIDGFLRSIGGQFRLQQQPNGQTLLEGTTWYRHEVWPMLYWKIYSDEIIHRIHERVLNHIKSQAEQAKNTP